jgi:hypothetical protein
LRPLLQERGAFAGGLEVSHGRSVPIYIDTKREKRSACQAPWAVAGIRAHRYSARVAGSAFFAFSVVDERRGETAEIAKNAKEVEAATRQTVAAAPSHVIRGQFRSILGIGFIGSRRWAVNFGNFGNRVQEPTRGFRKQPLDSACRRPAGSRWKPSAGRRSSKCPRGHVAAPNFGNYGNRLQSQRS